jgi:hypothetical protein
MGKKKGKSKVASGKPKPPTPLDKFEEQTSLALLAVIRTVLMDEMKAWFGMTKDDQEWLVEHYSLRMRYMDANMATFHMQLRSPSERGREVAYKWARHWAQAFLADPEEYKEKHPHSGYAGAE